MNYREVSKYDIWAPHSSIDEDLHLLAYDAVSVGKQAVVTVLERIRGLSSPQLFEFLGPEDGTSKLLRIVGSYLPTNTSSGFKLSKKTGLRI